LGEGRTSEVRAPSAKTCRRSMLLCDCDAGKAGGGGCETIVVFNPLPSKRVARVVLSTRLAGTDLNSADCVGVVILISKYSLSIVETSAVIVVLSVSSVWNVTMRRDLSPPNRREAREVQGDGVDD